MDYLILFNDDFSKSVKMFNRAKMKDYRYYPGGIVQEAIFLADELIKQLREDKK